MLPGTSGSSPVITSPPLVPDPTRPGSLPDPGRGDPLSLTRNPLVPVYQQYALGFPENPNVRPEDVADYMPLSVALATAHPYDAFVSAYSVPSIERRLATEAALKLEPTMVVFLIDVDAPKKNATPKWRAAEQKKIDALIDEHADGAYYFTRGGYRVVYVLAEPLVLRTRSDAVTWTASYKTWLDYLETRFGIIADRKCADWTHLLRLPRVVRDGAATEFEVRCDVRIDEIGLWSMPYVDHVDVPDADPGEVPDFEGAPPDDKMLAAIQALAAAWPETGIHGAQLALSGALARAGWPVELIAQFVASVCELHRPGNAKLEKRMVAARTSVEKIASGASVTGWPELAKTSDNLATAVSTATAALGIAWIDRSQSDGKFTEAMNAVPVAPLPPPTTIELRAAIAAGAKDRRGNSPEAERRRVLLKLVQRGAILDHKDRERDLQAAIEAVVSVAPAGTTRDQIATEVLALSPGADNALLIEHAMAAHRERSQAQMRAGEFSIDPHNGKPFANAQHNFDVALGKLGATLSYNTFSGRKMIGREGRSTIVQDIDVIELRYAIDEQFHFTPSKDELYDLVTSRARRKSFHPVCDYLDGVQSTWDGVPRIETWLIRLAGAEDTPFVRAVSRLILVAACRRVRSPGCKFDEVLVLECPTQGSLKSSAVKALSPDEAWVTDDLALDASTQKVIEQTRGKWIVEMSELKGRRGSRDHVKSALSRQVDEARGAYMREVEIVPRQFISFATVNDLQYLSDPTGNRRFWPVAIVRFDVETLKLERDQLWAEGATIEATGASIRLDESLWADAAVEQDGRRAVSLIEERLITAFEVDLVEVPLAPNQPWTGKILTEDVRRLAGFGANSPPPSSDQENIIVEAMGRLGWVRPKSYPEWSGKRRPSWVKGTTEERQRVLAASTDGHRVTRSQGTS